MPQHAGQRISGCSWPDAASIGFRRCGLATRSPSTTWRSLTLSSIAALVFDAMELPIHHAEPAQINAVNVPLDEMLEVTKDWQSSGFNVFSGGDLRRLGISAATVAALGQALSDPSAEAAVYARQYRDDAKAPSASVLSMKDGSGGRIAMYQQARTAGSNEAWLAICPATPQLVQVGVKTVLETLPYGEWKTHSRV